MISSKILGCIFEVIWVLGNCSNLLYFFVKQPSIFFPFFFISLRTVCVINFFISNKNHHKISIVLELMRQGKVTLSCLFYSSCDRCESFIETKEGFTELSSYPVCNHSATQQQGEYVWRCKLIFLFLVCSRAKLQ